jgi:hypothetical protein
MVGLGYLGWVLLLLLAVLAVLIVMSLVRRNRTPTEKPPDDDAGW